VSVVILVGIISPTIAHADFPPVKFAGVRSPVPRGGIGMVTIQTSSQIYCTIAVIYKSGPSKAQGLVPKTSDAQGRIRWMWRVGSRTTPGTWPIIVECG
jgi:micrococcal nuclease